jgi:hypothetical protein
LGGTGNGSPDAGEEAGVWRQYMTYRCADCGLRRSTDMMIYRFDDDAYHEEAYEKDRSMHESQARAANDPCPGCGGKDFAFAEWSDFPSRGEKGRSGGSDA